LHEVAVTRLPPDRLRIDPNAVVITEQHRVTEALVGLRAGIGSTLTGTGAAVLDRVSRTTTVRFAKDEPALAPYVGLTKPYLRTILDRGDRVVVEGTQGYGLSVLHTSHYPYATSRDTTAAGFLSEVGLSPLDVDEVALVIRSFPIRVPGHSGPLDNECSWDDVTTESASPERLEELTSVTKSVRRIGRFSPQIVREAIQSNRPTSVFLNHVDYWDHACRGRATVTTRALLAIARVEELISRRIDFVGIDERTLSRRAVELQGVA
jgi:adenylosuccinate synthase